MESETWRREVTAEIDRTLLEEARRNELKLAYVRAAAVGVSAALDFLFFLNPRPALGVDHLSPAIFLFSTTWFAVALGLAWVLRSGWYRPWLRTLLPLLDGVFVLLLFANLWHHLARYQPRYPGIITNMTAVCALVAVSGGLRLTRNAALLTTGLGLAGCALVTVLARLELALGLFVSVVVMAAGFLGVWMTGIVRRQLESEIGRSMLKRFLPGKVVEEAHHNPLALLTQPRSLDVTVVVTDLRGFTALSETLPPVEVLDFLNRIQGALARVVRDHGGTVDKFMGDGMLAVFGAPEPVADHAGRALRAARAMRAAVEEIKHGDRAVRLGIGVHSGPVVVGCLGDGARLEFTIIGDTVNATSRLESLTKEKGVDVLVSGETVRRAPGFDGLRSMGEVPIRGRKEPLEIHALG